MKSALLLFAVSAFGQTGGALQPVPIQQPLDNAGRTLQGQCLYTYAAGTTTPQTTYSNAALSVPNTNPIVLNGFGREPAVYLSAVSYKIVLAYASLGTCPVSPGTVIWSQDNVYDFGELLKVTLNGSGGAAQIGFQQAGGNLITVGGAIGSVGIYDIGYSSLSTACSEATAVPLLISKAWTAVPTQTLNCNMNFLPGGSIQPGASQTVTFAKFPVCPANQACFDTSVGGTTSIKFAGNNISTPVYAAWFGAVCNGILDPGAGGYHDDYPALMSAHSSLPLNQLAGGGMTPSGTPLPAGTVIIPDTATLASGPNGGCVIGPSDPGLYWSPYVRLQSSSSMFNSIIEAAQGWAPQVGGNYTVTGINTCGGGTVCTISVSSTTGLANGDTVELHGIAGFGVAGPWQLNSWANNLRQGYNLNSGMWAIANVTGTTFDLAGSGGLPSLAAWVSGGTAIKGTEKFLLTLINTHDGSSAYPVDNYNVNIGDISFYAQAANNQFASGLFCNCSVSTWIHHDLISVPYRAFVAAIGIDNVTVDDLLITGTARSNGPDGQAMVLSTNDPQETFATHVRNLKINGANYRNWTPALSIAGGVTTFHLDVADFENVAWPIAVNIGLELGQNISLEHITAKTDTFFGNSCPSPLLTTVVAIFNSPSNNQVGTGINTSGDFQCFANSITQGSAPAGLTQVPGMPLPQGLSDSGWLPLTYDDNNFITHSYLAAPWDNTIPYGSRAVVTCAIAVCTTQMGSSVSYQAITNTTNNRPDLSPSDWVSINGGSTSAAIFTGFNTYTNGVYTHSPWFANQQIASLSPTNTSGYRCFSNYWGVGAPSAASFEWLLIAGNACNAPDSPESSQHRFIEARPSSVACPNNSSIFGFGLCLDGEGNVGTGIGGSLYLNGLETNGGVAFSALPTPNAGMRIWVMDGAVGSNPCAGSGNGTWAETISTGPSTFKWICR